MEDDAIVVDDEMMQFLSKNEDSEEDKADATVDKEDEEVLVESATLLPLFDYLQQRTDVFAQETAIKKKRDDLQESFAKKVAEWKMETLEVVNGMLQMQDSLLKDDQDMLTAIQGHLQSATQSSNQDSKASTAASKLTKAEPVFTLEDENMVNAIGFCWSDTKNGGFKIGRGVTTKQLDSLHTYTLVLSIGVPYCNASLPITTLLGDEEITHTVTINEGRGQVVIQGTPVIWFDEKGFYASHLKKMEFFQN